MDKVDRQWAENGFSVLIDGERASGMGRRQFGFMMITPAAAGAWTGTLLSPAGKTLAVCSSAGAKPGTPAPVCAMP